MAEPIVPPTPQESSIPILPSPPAAGFYASDGLELLMVELLIEDQHALHNLVRAILANRRLAWMIVDAWLRQNHKLLVDA